MTEKNEQIYTDIVSDLKEKGYADADIALVQEIHKRMTSGGVVSKNKKESDTYDLLVYWSSAMDSYFD